MKKIVVKRNKEEEEFNEEKFCKNLINLGIDEDKVNKICKNIYDKIPQRVSSHELFKITLNELKKEHIGLALKYNLKDAIYKLGPTGFPFEKYVGKILANYGYETFTNMWIDGICLEYEIDVLAIKENEKFIIECKYHQDYGVKSDLKTVLYVFGRWIDIKEKNSDLKPWLITNTKITYEGIQFAECKNLKITAWKYPKDESLEKLIENKFLYPTTILIGISKDIIKNLVINNFVLIQDFLWFPLEDISKKTGISLNILEKIKKQIEALIEIKENSNNF